jgi:hypothetical protein
LQDHNGVGLLGDLGRTEYRAHCQVVVIFYFLWMDYHTYMDVMVRSKLSKTTGYHVLKFKFLRSRCLLGEHKLHVINAN